jgi:putative ABC transport system permease protein
MSKHRPPAWADKFLQFYCNPKLLEEIQGDAYELFYRTVRSGTARANLLFVWNVIRFFRWKNIKRSSSSSPNRFDMLQHYLKLGFRNLVKNKNHAIINITGLAVAIGAVLLMALYVQFELTYDNKLAKKANMYRVVQVDKEDNATGLAKITGMLGPAAGRELPGVKSFARISWAAGPMFGVGETKAYENNGLFVDSNFFDVFNYRIIEGNPSTMLSTPNSVVLTPNLVTKYFGEAPAIGKTITINNQDQVVVTGVVEPVQQNTHFNFTFLFPIEADQRGWKEVWIRQQYYTYIEVDENVSITDIEAQIAGIYARNLPPDAISFEPKLQPLTSIHLHSALSREIGTNGSMKTVYIYISIAMLVLIIACINYINIFTAKAGERLKEIGMRKVSGAKRSELVRQFLSESIVLTFIAAGVGVGLALLTLPYFSYAIETPLMASGILNPVFLGVFVAALFVVSTLAGSYPAFYLSAMKPVLLQRASSSPSKNRWREGLVLAQFTISAFMIAALLGVAGQLEYMDNMSLGFTKDNLILITVRDRNTIKSRESLIEKLKSNPHVVDVSFSGTTLGGNDWGVPVEAEDTDPNKTPNNRVMVVDENFVKTYGLSMLEGRSFSSEFPTDSVHSVLVSAKAAREFGWGDNIIGRKVKIPAPGVDAQVVGVVDDFHFRSLHQESPGIVFFMTPSWFGSVTIRLDGQANSEAIDGIADVWKTYEPAFPFSYYWLDESLEQLYRGDRNTGRLVTWSGILALVLACIGLFSLTAYQATRRSREFGIRKVLGASVQSILTLQLKTYVLIAGLGSTMACLLAWYAMEKWLTGFAHRTTTQPSWFVVSIIASIFIALATSTYQSLKSAMVNPVQSIKSNQ